ncbi:hypothetical protein [Nostoc sp.]|uniref:hypothetical protein n=1 Tax=Nostoc sp. TaxID=1180 RepID=UPI002FFA7370
MPHAQYLVATVAVKNTKLINSTFKLEQKFGIAFIGGLEFSIGELPVITLCLMHYLTV